MGLVAVIALPLVAATSASRPSLPPLGGLPPITSGRGGAIRNVPVFVPAAGYTAAALVSPGLFENAASLTAAVDHLAVTALGPIQGKRLLALQPGLSPIQLPDGSVPDDHGADAVIQAAWGSRSPGANRLSALTDLGALLEVAEANQGTLPRTTTTTGITVPPDVDGIAITVLRRAAAGGSCSARLDYLLELLSDPYVSSATAMTQLESAEASCPHDPTPLWLAGESELFGERALSTFRQLEQAYPRSPGGWSGEADAVLLQAQAASEEHEPFTAESRYRRAALLLQRARSLLSGPDPGLAAVEASAWSSSGDPARAVPVDRLALTGRPDQANGIQLADDLERTDRFGQAGALLGHLPPPARAGPRASLFPAPVPRGSGPSLGAGTRVGLTVQAEPITSPAEEVQADVLIPPYRADLDPFGQFELTDLADSANASEARVRDLLLSGDPRPATRSGSPLMTAIGQLAEGHALAGVAGLAVACRTSAAEPAGSSVGPWCDGVSAEADTVGVDLQLADTWYGTGSPPTVSQLDTRVAFDLENLWRWAGQYGRAAAVTTAWLARSPHNFLAVDQGGEVAYLLGQNRAAQRLFERAVALAPSAAVAEAEHLKVGETEAAGGNGSGALRTFSAVARTASTAPDAALNLRYLADFETAGLQLRDHDAVAAVHDYQSDRSMTGNNPDDVLPVEVPAALDTNQGLAEVQAGRPRAGLPDLQAALHTDPDNPVFLQNVAYADRRVGATAAAATDYRLALTADPTNYPAANDLGVLLADQGRLAPAATALRLAVAAGPQDALARFNLGVVLSREGPGHVLEAEGDFGAAARMDPSLAATAPLPRFDDGTVLTTLDLSRPPPPGWHFGEAETDSPEAAASLALLVLLVGLGRELARDKVAEKAEERVLDRAGSSPRRRRRWWSTWRPGPVLAAAFTAAALTWPLASSTGATWTDDVLLAVAVLLMVAVYMRIHLIVSRSAASPLRHHTWVPPLGVASVAAVVHLAFAPLPVAEPREEHHRRRRWMPPLVLGATGVLLLVIARVTGVPAAKAFGSAALVITSSALIPVEPSDGAYLGGRLPALLASVTMLAVSTLLFVGIL